MLRYTAAGLGGAEDTLRNLVCETRVRIAVTSARAEALAAAATQTPLEWHPAKQQVLVRLYGGGAATAAVDVPFEWPLHGARVRMVGLAGLAPAVVASAAQRGGCYAYKLNSVDPQLASAWFLQPLTVASKNLVSKLVFHIQLVSLRRGWTPAGTSRWRPRCEPRRMPSPPPGTSLP